MPRRKKTRSIVLVGRSWFDKVNGNSYCTTEIVINGELVRVEGPVSGYGDYFVQIAAEWLDANGYLPGLEKHPNGSYEPLWSYCPKHNITLYRTKATVGRKKDL